MSQVPLLDTGYLFRIHYAIQKSFSAQQERLNSLIHLSVHDRTVKTDFLFLIINIDGKRRKDRRPKSRGDVAVAELFRLQDN